MSRLFVLGNGFDLAHQLKSSYSNFKNFVQTRNPNLHATLNRISCGKLWSDVEHELGYVDFSEIIDEMLKEHGYDGMSLRENRQQDITDSWRIATHLRSFKEQLTREILGEFSSWIDGVDRQIGNIQQKFKDIEPDDFVICFNYTSTVEDVYNVASSHVFYPHGNNRQFRPYYEMELAGVCFDMETPQKLVFGHGRPDSPQIPLKFSPRTTIDYDIQVAGLNLHEAVNELFEFYSETRKRTDLILGGLEKYLCRVASENVHEVVIIGFSIGLVDQPYLRCIDRLLGNHVKYTITHYGRSGLSMITERVKACQISASRVEFIDLSTTNRLFL